MMRKQLAIAALGAGLLGLSTPDAHGSSIEDAEVVIEWNQILQSTIPATVGLQTPRYFAMMHIAMFDAVNSIDRGYSRYHVRVAASHGASQEAAAAQAAHDVLVSLIPTAQPTFDAALATRLAPINPDRALQGVRVGQKVAAAILAWRQNDGWADPAPSYVLPPIPGLWQPTPPGFLAAAFTQYPGVDPFALLTPTQFLPRRFPELTSAEYAADFEEVKQIGSATSAVRTTEQTQLSRLFAGVTSHTSLFALWNNVARDVAREHTLSLVDTARVFALVNVAINDGLQTSHSSKFVYALWRPVTAIRRADEDMNPVTVSDATWTPLLTTPPYPSHSGNMACVGASAARLLANVFGTNDIAFTAIWFGNTGNPDVSKSYAGFWQMAQDQALSRLHGGIHFSFENEASQESCPKVADYVFANYLIPRRWH